MATVYQKKLVSYRSYEKHCESTERSSSILESELWSHHCLHASKVSYGYVLHALYPIPLLFNPIPHSRKNPFFGLFSSSHLSFVCPSGMEFGVKQQKRKSSLKHLLRSLPYRAIGAFLASILALLFGLRKIYADVLFPIFSHG